MPLQKPKFYNKIIATSNKYWNVFKSDFEDSQWRIWNVITLKSKKHWDWSFILAFTRDKKIILNRDYKFWPDDFIYTLPSWFIERSLWWEENILNELQEETWYTTNGEVISLWKTMQNWYIDWYNQLYFTTGCTKTHNINTHEWEEIETFLATIDEFENMLLKYEILDPYSEICYYRAKEKTKNFTNI